MYRVLVRSLAVVLSCLAASARAEDPSKIHIAFLWHMHQPIYWPGETIVETDANARYPFSVIDVHTTRTGPYTTWPADAVQSGSSLPHLGAQVSFSGSLVRNLDALAAAGIGSFGNWTQAWTQWSNTNTALGNPRLEMVAFGEHHPLMPLIASEDVVAQIDRHRQILAQRIGAPASRGIFPPENAVHPRMLGALVSAGLEWVLVDNVHFDRAAQGYPWNSGGNLYEPNGADVRNPNPGDWVSLNGLWAPTPVSARWGHQPHFVQSVDPETGAVQRIVAVPTSRYLGNEDGRGGFGALDYEGVLSQLEPYNTDPDHPILVVLHHDGDNYGGGSDSYYHANFQAFVQWLNANPTRFECTTIQDYLDRFPPAMDDVIHIEAGSWSGADNGDPEFAKWLGDPNVAGESPDRNSWAVLTAVTNRVRQALDVAPGDARALAAQEFLLNGQASDYWYWDFSLDGIWDSQPTRAANLALDELGTLLDGAVDRVGPTVFAPQREPWNPGGTEWGIVQPTSFQVWTLVDDAAGVTNVTLRVREDLDGALDPVTNDNATFAGGPGVGSWIEIPMAVDPLPAATTDPLPLLRATRYSATVDGVAGTLYDYSVRAVDAAGNVTDSPIEHVAVGAGGSVATDVSWTPETPGPDDVITIILAGESRDVALHWGFDGFTTPPAGVWPTGTEVFPGGGGAVETPFGVDGVDRVLELGPFGADTPLHLDFVLHYADDTWNNNGGQDWAIVFDGGSSSEPPFGIDGILDAGTTLVDGVHPLHFQVDGDWLYLATDPATGTGEDTFLVLGADGATTSAAPWAKAGTVPAWTAFVGSEESNGWAGWFDAPGTSSVTSGSVLEARIDLRAAFGGVRPAAVRVAALRYGSSDAGALVGQTPSGDLDADVTLDETWRIDLTATNAPSTRDDMLVLHGAHPNPFNPRTTIYFALERASEVEISIHDVAGRRVRRVDPGVLSAGEHAFTWTGRDARGRTVSTGVYLVHVRAAGTTRTLKVSLVK
mgnify:CR=1 FL=1